MFNKVSSNILLEIIPSDPVQPASSVWANVANMQINNSGVELDLDYKLTTAGGWKYNVGGNLTLIKNEVVNSPYTVIQSGGASGSGLTSATINGYVNGQPIGTFFLKDFTGIDAKVLVAIAIQMVTELYLTRTVFQQVQHCQAHSITSLEMYPIKV